jgi:hypothetical protein
MRIHSGAGRVGLSLILLAGCSTSEPIIETATVRTAPPTTIGPITEPLVLTIPKIVKTAPPTIPSTGPTTVPVDAAGSTLISGPTITEDEAAIKLVIEKVTLADFEGRYKETFDPAPFEGKVSAKYLASLEASFKTRRALNQIRRPGTVFQVIVHKIRITSADKANAVSCNRNDIQVWDTKGTPDQADDSLIDGQLGLVTEGKQLSKIAGNWQIDTAAKIGGEWCEGVF